MNAGKVAGLYENPFNPGYGQPPPYLAGRGAERFSVFRHVGNTANGKLVARDVVIYGPRGSGKTALLRVLAKEIAQLKTNVTLGLMPATDLQSAEDARRELIGVVGQPLWEALKPQEWGLDWHGLQAKWQRGELPRSEVRKGLVVKCKQKPLILMVDEAHEMAPTACKELLNEILTIRGLGGPAIVLLAGKPALVDFGDLAHVSFLERGEMVSLDLLDAQGAADAVRIPLDQTGISISDDALGKVVSDSQGYPQFLQLWGSALWDQASAHGAQRIDGGDVAEVGAIMEQERTEVYLGRLGSWKSQDRKLLVKVARKLLRDGWMESQQLEETIEQELTEQGRDVQGCQAIMDHMVDSDFLWRPRGQAKMIPALPSFVSFVAGQGESTLRR